MNRYLCSFIVALCVLGSSGCRSLSPGASSSPCDASTCVLDVDCDSSFDSIACDGGCNFDGSCDSDGGCDSLGFGQVVRGRKIAWLDRTGSVLGSINKLALWDRRADNHDVSRSTETAVVSYLQQHGLGNTLVRVNQYAPIDEWRRLTSNKRIAAPWRYTFGAYDWLKYTLIPGRLMGGDWYNPFTDSVHIYSDIPAIGLSKAAYAKDVHSRTLPGTYASFQDAPLIGLYHEKIANAEVINHIKKHGNPTQLAEAKRILEPDFSGSIGAQTLGFLPYGSVYGRAAGALVGHATRQVQARTAGFTMPNK